MLPNLSALTLRCRPCGEAFDLFVDAQDGAPETLPDGRVVPEVTIVDGATCAICLEALENNAEGSKSASKAVEALFETCGHVFHAECLAKQFRSGNRRCSMCRTRVDNEVWTRLGGSESGGGEEAQAQAEAEEEELEELLPSPQEVETLWERVNVPFDYPNDWSALWVVRMMRYWWSQVKHHVWPTQIPGVQPSARTMGSPHKTALRLKTASST